jgi:biotin transporter BioY
MLEFLTLACGLLMPFVVSWLKGRNWPDWAKVLLSLGLSIVGGALVAFVDGSLNLQTLAHSSTAIFTSATVFYKLWFETTSVNSHLEQLQPLNRPAPRSRPGSSASTSDQ